VTRSVAARGRGASKQRVGLRLVAQGERSEGRGGGLRGTSTRSHGAQAVRSARDEPNLRGERLTPASTQDMIEPKRGPVACSAPLCGLTMTSSRTPQRIIEATD